MCLRGWGSPRKGVPAPWFPVRAHAWAAGRSWLGECEMLPIRDSPTPQHFSLHPFLSRYKINKSNLKRWNVNEKHKHIFLFNVFLRKKAGPWQFWVFPCPVACSRCGFWLGGGERVSSAWVLLPAGRGLAGLYWEVSVRILSGKCRMKGHGSLLKIF